jgi:hypothetical protein
MKGNLSAIGLKEILVKLKERQSRPRQTTHSAAWQLQRWFFTP